MLTNHDTGKRRDHGGGLDDAVARWGGTRGGWIDLSTGINPVPYPMPEFEASDWSNLPDAAARNALLTAARRFWRVPDRFAILASPGASALIAALPTAFSGTQVRIPAPTYNEHAAAFAAAGWDVAAGGTGDATVLVHPNNPDGRCWSKSELDTNQLVIDESFADVDPDLSLLEHVSNDGTCILKSFGKFWGLAGMRLGFAIGSPALIAKLADRIGPWAVSGPALRTGALALQDAEWARETRARLDADAARLDRLMATQGHVAVGGTSLFRLYETGSAADFQDKLAQAHIWSRVFPYSQNWVRLGLPAPHDWSRLEAAVAK